MQLQPARCIGVAAHQFARRTTLFQVLQPRIASKDREIAQNPVQLSHLALTANTEPHRWVQRNPDSWKASNARASTV